MYNSFTGACLLNGLGAGPCNWRRQQQQQNQRLRIERRGGRPREGKVGNENEAIVWGGEEEEEEEGGGLGVGST